MRPNINPCKTPVPSYLIEDEVLCTFGLITLKPIQIYNLYAVMPRFYYRTVVKRIKPYWKVPKYRKGIFFQSVYNRIISLNSRAATSIGRVSRSLCWLHIIPWWHHQMKTFSALLAIFAGNLPVTGEFPAQRPVRGALMFSLIYTWVNNCDAGDLRRNGTHYDVIVMTIIWWKYSRYCSNANKTIVITSFKDLYLLKLSAKSYSSCLTYIVYKNKIVAPLQIF